MQEVIAKKYDALAIGLFELCICSTLMCVCVEAKSMARQG